MAAGDGFLRTTDVRASALARVGIVERRLPILAPSIQTPRSSGPYYGLRSPAAPPRIRRRARSATSAAPAPPLNVVDILLLQRREVHPFHPLSVDHLPRSPSPSAQRRHESPRGPLGPHEAWHARQFELGEYPGTLASPRRAVGLRADRKRGRLQGSPQWGRGDHSYEGAALEVRVPAGYSLVEHLDKLLSRSEQSLPLPLSPASRPAYPIQFKQRSRKQVKL